MKPLRKDDKPPLDVESMAPDQVQAHPIFAGGRYGLMSADAPRFPAKVQGGAKALEEHLHKQGLKFERTAGMYDGPETSYIIHNPSREQMLQLGSDFGQESVIWGAGGNHEFHYTNGPNAGMFVQGHPQQSVSYYQHRPSNFWTAMPNDLGFFRLNFDPEWKLRPGTELKAEAVVKHEPIFEALEKAMPKHGRNPLQVHHRDSPEIKELFKRRDQLRSQLANAQAAGNLRPKEANILGHHIGKLHAAIQELRLKGFKPAPKPDAKPMSNVLDQHTPVGPARSMEPLTETPSPTKVRMPGATFEKEWLPKLQGPSGYVPDIKWKKSEPFENYRPHPHAYEWHDGHTDHHAGLVKADEHPHTSSFPKNDQAAGVGVSTYAKYAAPYGTVTPGIKTNLLHYPMHGMADAAKQLVRSHGYEPYYAGGRYGKPDLVRRNYNTKHLMIYDPTPGSGADFNSGDYADGWRHVHELAHALTYPELNQIYGEGRRIGKLGVHRNMREAARAVHWEWLAAHKQRELSAQMGVHIPDDVFHKELNTVMHDAVHRAVTGQFTEPSGEGFLPHAHKVPLETALGMIQEAGSNLGLRGPDDLLQRKSETMTTATPLAALRKAVLEKLKKTEADLIELAEREATATKLKAPPADPRMAKAEAVVKSMPEHARQDYANRFGFTHRWYRELNKSAPPDEIGSSESRDYRGARDAQLVKHLAAGYEKAEKALTKGLGDQHMEPGVHENAAPGATPHAEPGGHEMASMPVADEPPASPVGSSAASAGVPSAELAPPAISQPAPVSADPAGDPTAQGPDMNAELCPTCGNADVPGQCTCLPGQDQMAAPPAAEAMAMSEGVQKNAAMGYGQGAPGAMSPAGTNQPMAMSDKEPQSQPATSASTSPMAMNESMCKACGKSHGLDKCSDGLQPKPGNDQGMMKTDLVATDGSKKSVGVNGKLPPKGADGDLGPGMAGADPKKVPSPGSGGQKNAKAEPPMAKPPSGKNPATMTPTASAGAPKVQGAPGGMAKAALPATPKAQMAQHAQVAGSKAAAGAPAAGAAPAAMPSPAQHAGRAQAFQSAAAGAFQPKGPVVSGLELAPKKPAGMMAPPGSVRQPTGPGPAQKSPFGKNEKCVFCGRSEHPGDCKP